MRWKLLIFGILIITSTGNMAMAEALPETPYVDLDGDGFDDNIADNNENGIPDRFESKPAEALAEMSGLLGNVFNTDVNLDDLRTKSEKFKMRKFKTRALKQRCQGLGAEDDFGSGGGLNLGSAGGGGCAGGVCRP
jgi:hypothetical protein